MPLKQREVELHEKRVNGNRKNSRLGLGWKNLASFPWGEQPANTAISPAPGTRMGALSIVFTYSFMLK
jgi:hypothetical protein